MEKKLLLVEHQQNLRRLMGLFLSRFFKVVTSGNALEAMAWLTRRGFHPDVLVVAADIKGPTALQLVTNVRHSGMFGHLHVVVLGGQRSAEELHTFRQLGVHLFDGKTVDLVHLKDFLTALSPTHIETPAELEAAG